MSYFLIKFNKKGFCLKKQSYRLLFFVIWAVIVSLLVVGLLKQKRSFTDEYGSQILNNMQYTLLPSRYISDAIFEIVSSNSEIIEIINRMDDEDDEALKRKYRIVIKDILRSSYEHLNKLGFVQMQFHDKYGKSLLRFSNEDIYDDSLIYARPSIKKMVEEQTEFSGFEVGKLQSGIRYLYPIFDERKYIGSFETVLNPMYVGRELEKKLGGNFHFLIKKNTIEKNTLGSFSDTYRTSDISEEFYEIKQDSRIKPEQTISITDTFPKIDEIKTPILTYDTYGFQDYLVGIYPIHSISGEIESYFIFSKKSNELFGFTKDTILEISAFSIVLLIIYKLLTNLQRERNIAVLHREETDRLNKKLNELNKNLEENIKNEVEKNREKDLLILEQSRYATMGELLNNISHQWRQPLSGISLGIESIGEMLDEEVIDKEFIGKTIEHTVKEIEYLSKTIDGFRKYFAIKNEKKRVNLKKELESIIKLISSKSTIKSQTRVIGAELELIINFSELSQVCINILNNSFDKFEELQKHNPDFIGDINIEISRDENFLTLALEDNGGGIKPEIIDKIYEPYFTTKFQSRGTGIGLYMCKIVMENHLKGSIRAYNKTRGACFELKIPLDPQDKETTYL